MVDILDRILELRYQRGWSERQLAEESNLPQSTISSWYRKKLLPSLASVENLCNAFHITLSQFFMEDITCYIISKEDQKIIQEWNKLDNRQKDALYNFMRSL